MDSFKTDPGTEAKLTFALTTIEDKYGTDGGFYSAMIDFQDKELLVFIHPSSGLTADQFEEDVDYAVGVNVNEGKHGPISCTSRDRTCSSPLYGGVTIKRYGDPQGPGTIGYYATHNNGARGFVTAGHVADFLNASITQPENGRIIGTVTEYCGSEVRMCDGAFVKLRSGESGSNRIYKTSSTYYNIIGTTADSEQRMGKFVKKSGSTTDVTYGYIIGNLPSKNTNTIRFTTGDGALGGDSGSPVFYQPSTRSNNVYLYGLLVSNLGGGEYGVYHPADYLANKLKLR